MKYIEYKYSNTSWGQNKNETFQIDLIKKEYRHYTKDVLDDTLPLDENIVQGITKLFAVIYNDFPNDQFAFDAPMFSLTIDDKTCTQIACLDQNAFYKKIHDFFEIFK